MEDAINKILTWVNRQPEGPVGNFNLEVFLAKAIYAEVLRALTAAAESGVLGLSYLEAIEQKILPATGTLSGKHLYAWAVEAGTDEFNNRVAARQQSESQKETDATTAQDAANVRAFEALRSHYRMMKSSTVEHYDEVAKQFKDVVSRWTERMKTEALSDLSSSFSVVTGYSEESEMEVNRKCWEKFLAEKAATGCPVPAITEDNLRKAISHFGQLVRMNHQAAYLRELERAGRLQGLSEAYINGLISALCRQETAKLGFIVNDGTLANLCFHLEPTHDLDQLYNGIKTRMAPFTVPSPVKPDPAPDREERLHHEQASHADDERQHSQTHQRSKRGRPPHKVSNKVTTATTPRAPPAPAPAQGAPRMLTAAQIKSGASQRRGWETRHAKCAASTATSVANRTRASVNSKEAAGTAGKPSSGAVMDTETWRNVGEDSGEVFMRVD